MYAYFIKCPLQSSSPSSPLPFQTAPVCFTDYEPHFNPPHLLGKVIVGNVDEKIARNVSNSGVGVGHTDGPFKR
jgi:hypothetical protein